MKQILYYIIICMLANIGLQAQNIQALDIEKSTDAYAINNMYSTRNMYAELNGVFYYTANDGIHGGELWRSDATAAGTYLVKDIKPGPDASNTNDIITSGNYIYFSASDGVHGQQLWKSDGTADGTVMVTDLTIYTANPNPSHITDVNGTVYFVTDYFGLPGSQLFKTNGTAAGTEMIVDFNVQYSANNLRQLTNINDKLYFTADQFGYDRRLCISDGTFAGTQFITDINPFGYDEVGNLTSLNGLCYFSAFDGTTTHLYVSDGTAQNTYAVAGNVSLPLWYGFEDQPFTVRAGTLFFQGLENNTGIELYKFNTTIANPTVKLVKDIIPGTASSYPSFITNVNGKVFFTIGPVDGDAQLWKTDGTNAGTQLVKDINPGGINYYYGLTNMNGTLMFVFANEALGHELWKSDGTSNGTVLVKDIFPGIYSSYPQYLTYKNNQFIFGAGNNSKGFELWKSDGTETGTKLIKDINQSSTSSSYTFGFTEIKNGNKALFTAATDKYGYELYSSDGTSEGTKLVKDINPGSFSSFPFLQTRVNNFVYFFSYDKKGIYLSKSNGTSAGTSQFFDVTNKGFFSQVAATSKLFFFSIIDYSFATIQLWRSDGTAEGTYAVKTDIPYFQPLNITGAGKYVYFSSYDVENGTELWKSDGTAEGTTLVKDINPGTSSSSPFNLASFNNKLYFAADAGYGPFLWATDGTEAGTQVIKEAIISYYIPFAQANNLLFFNAFSTVANGYELYATDGTPAGTNLVKDVNKGPASSNPYLLTSGETQMYFFADDGIHGNQLWVSDGTRGNTHTVIVVPGGNFYSAYYQLTVADKLFFIIADTLWQSDGTAAGTHKVNDEALNGARNISNLAAVGNSLYFSAYNNMIGQELFVANAEDLFAPQNNPQSITKATLPSPDFSVKLLTNPFQNRLQLNVESKTQQTAQLTITDVAGKVIQSQKISLSAGINNILYNTTAWQQGMYMIKITSANGSSISIKAIKAQ